VVFGVDNNGDGVADEIYAKNGRTGEIEFGGTNASTVIQQVINALRDGGKKGIVFIKEGHYILSDSLNVSSGITIRGSGRRWHYEEGGTTLEANFTSLKPIIQGTGEDVHNFKLEDLSLKGNSNVTVFLDLKKFHDAQINSISLLNFGVNVTGINLESTDSTSDWNFINDIIMVQEGLPDRPSGSTGVRIVSPSWGIQSNFNIIRGLKIWGAVETGVFIDEESAMNRIEDSVFYWTLNGIDCYGGHNTISHCWFEGGNQEVQSVGIRIREGALYNKIFENFFTEDVQTKIINSGSHTFIRYNEPSYATENSGNAIVANNDYIAHGLASTPTKILLTANSTEPRILQVIFQNSTHFQVGFWNASNSPPSPITVPEPIFWYAEV
jgi:hypothetical protein